MAFLDAEPAALGTTGATTRALFELGISLADDAASLALLVTGAWLTGAFCAAAFIGGALRRWPLLIKAVEEEEEVAAAGLEATPFSGRTDVGFENASVRADLAAPARFFIDAATAARLAALNLALF